MIFARGKLALAAAASVLTLAVASGAARADDTTYVMKITTPTLNAALDQYAKVFGAAVEKDSGGRIKTEVYPASQLGSIPRQIEGTQFGAIQCAVIPPEFFVGVDERFEVLAAPGLVTSSEQGQKIAGDPEGAEILSRAWRQQGAARRCGFLCRAGRGDLEERDPASGRFQGQENPHLRLGIPVGRVQAARAPRRLPCRPATS